MKPESMFSQDNRFSSHLSFSV